MTDKQICARDDCEVEIVSKKAANQKFCSEECQKIVTNARLMRDYHNKQARKKGKSVPCSDCGTALSRYNFDDRCGACQLKAEKDANDSVQNLFVGVSVA